jgi:hypothetical protein
VKGGRLIAVILVLLAAWTIPVEAQETLHGADAVFHGAGLRIAWAVARDRDDAKTVVMIHILDTTKRFRAIEVDGLDPFTQKTEIVLSRQALDGEIELALLRSRFAELPRTELRFYGDGPIALTVYYLGVPDTTPEFADKTAARGYLAGAIAK